MNDNDQVIEEEKEEEVSEETDEAPKKASSKKDEVTELKEKVEDLENQLKRSVADYRNLQKRFEDEKREYAKYANKDLLVRLIPAFDTLFLAGKFSSDEGVKLTVRHLHDVLKEVGVERVDTEGSDYDPVLMEAVSTEDGEEGKVLEELRPGYTLNGKLIRPAQVKVGKKAIDN